MKIGEVCAFMQGENWSVGKVLQFSKYKNKTISGQQYKGFSATVSKDDIGVLCSWFSSLKGSANVFQLCDNKSTAHTYIPISCYLCSICRSDCLQPVVVKVKVSCMVLQVTRKWLQLSKSCFQKNAKHLWINDNHVASTQILLKQQFLQLGGLDFTLKQETKSLKPLLPNSLQVIHVDGNHWAAASTVNCKREDIMIYDSLYCSVNCKTKHLLARLVHTSKPVFFWCEWLSSPDQVHVAYLQLLTSQTLLSEETQSIMYSSKAKGEDIYTNIWSNVKWNHFLSPGKKGHQVCVKWKKSTKSTFNATAIVQIMV